MNHLDDDAELYALGLTDRERDVFALVAAAFSALRLSREAPPQTRSSP